MKHLGLFAAGVLFGTAGLKILSSKDAKKVYSHTTAAVLRAKDCVMQAVTNVREDAEDVYADAKADTVKEFLGVLDGVLTEPEAIELVKLRSRQYAKRQLTWLRRNPDIHWIFWEKDRDFARALQISTEILSASGLG